MVMLNSGGSAGSGSGISPTAPTAAEPPDPPKDAKEAAKADPGKSDEPKPLEPPKPKKYSSAAKVLKDADEDGTPFCEECSRASEEEEEQKTSWIEFQLVGEDGKPIPDEAYSVKMPDGTVEEGNLDDEGKGKVEGFEKGDCKISFPNLDQEAWEDA
jgi:type VI secretion system secreted protein VgrG